MPHPGGRRRLRETAAARIGAFGGDGVSTRLELVGQRLELPRLSAGAVRQRLREQPVGQPRVAREQRPVEIRPDRPSDAGAFEAALPVVSEAGEDAAERLGRVLAGFGNDGESGFEGARVGRAIGTYLHGPLLPRNPWLADWLLAQALAHRTGGEPRELEPLADELEARAHAVSAERAYARGGRFS